MKSIVAVLLMTLGQLPTLNQCEWRRDIFNDWERLVREQLEVEDKPRERASLIHEEEIVRGYIKMNNAVLASYCVATEN